MRRCSMKKVVVMAIVIGFLFAFAPTQARSAEIVLKAVTMFPKPHLNNDPVPIFIDKVNKRAQGRLRIDWVGGPEVIKGFDQPHAIKAGTIDMILYMAFAYCKSLMPEAEAQGLSELAIWEERKTGAFELWSEIFEKKLNAKYIGRLHSLCPFQVYTNKEVKTVEDFKGLKIRVMPLYVPFMKALGVAPVMIRPPEIYTSMERGVVDGYMWPNAGVISWGLQEVTKYVIRPGVFQMEPATLIHMKKWNKIPKDLQEIIMDVIQDVEYIGTMRNEMIMDKEDEVRKAAGMKDIVLAPAEAEKFRKLAYDKTWEVVIKNAPEYGPKLRELSSKKAIPKGTFPWQ
jgi:TRAP-type C4-dicarboxylate transport system substrate-binding protein